MKEALCTNNFLRFSVLFLLIFTIPSLASNTPEKFGASIAKTKKANLNINLVNKGIYLNKTLGGTWKSFESGPKIGQTFEALPFDESNGIKTFNRDVSRNLLQRDLFGLPQFTASFYYAKYDKKSVFVESTYLQIISDTRWNRLLYGSLAGSLRSYDNISGPGEIAVSPLGQIFVAEKGKSQILVFRINGKGKAAKLEFRYAIKNIMEPTSLAYNDGGTPFDRSDDFLFVADASQNTITKFMIKENSVEKSKIYKGFKWPVSITSGRWNGANNDQLFVIDSYAKKVTLYEENNGELNKLLQISAKNNQTFSKVEVDHFGQVYLSDAVNGELFKFTANLELLDSKKMQENSGINDLSIPFGTVEIEGDGKYWAGFDQLFALQTWNDKSGMERFKLGLSLKDQTLSISEDYDLLRTDYTITDFAETRYSIYSPDNKKIFESEKKWSASGNNSATWLRRDNNNEQVKAGYYTFELEVSSAYQKEPLIQKSSFYLPMYYHVDCGNEDGTKAINLINGQAKGRDGNLYIEDDERVQYTISGLDPNSEYKISAYYPGFDDADRSQELLIDGIFVHEFLEVKSEGAKTGFYEVPSESFSDGEILITISGDGLVAVSDIWFKETGKNFTLQDPQKIIPTVFKLEQNYPNPFNPTTTISYRLPTGSEINLTIYDMLGRKVKTLVNSYQDAGVYSVNFDASGLASGLYFYQVKAGKLLETRKMLLVK